MMPIYRRRRLSKRTRNRASFRVPGIDPRVLRFRYSSGTQQHAHIIRPLLQLVERQNSSLASLPRMEKRLEEVTKRLEIFSELNDAYQALIENLKGVQQEQMKKIELLQSTIDRLQKSPESQHSAAEESVQEDEEEDEEEEIVEEEVDEAETPSLDLPADLRIDLESADEAAHMDTSTYEHANGECGAVASRVGEGEVDEDQSQLETEIIYDFVV